MSHARVRSMVPRTYPFPSSLATRTLPPTLLTSGSVGRVQFRAAVSNGLYDLLEAMVPPCTGPGSPQVPPLPTPTEAALLGLPKDVPLLRIVRTSSDRTMLEVKRHTHVRRCVRGRALGDPLFLRGELRTSRYTSRRLAGLMKSA